MVGNIYIRGAGGQNDNVGVTTFSGDVTLSSGNKLLIGTTDEGWTGYDELTIATSGNTGMTIRSGTSNTGAIAFADGTSGDAEYRGIIKYGHSDDDFFFCTNGDTTRMKVASDIIETGTKTITGGNNLDYIYNWEGDLNGDGVPDLVLGNMGQNGLYKPNMKLYLNDYDQTVWPHCRKGFFQLGKSIDSLIDTLGLDG